MPVIYGICEGLARVLQLASLPSNKEDKSKEEEESERELSLFMLP